MSTEEWILKRIGCSEPEFALHNFQSIIKIGRSDSNNKQCLAKGISRYHLNLHRVTGADGHIYWNLEHVSTTSKTFINGAEVPNSTHIRLNSNDLISLGENLTPSSCQGKRQSFLYKIVAPSMWDDNSEDENEIVDSALTQTQTSPDSPVDSSSDVKKSDVGDINVNVEKATPVNEIEIVKIVEKNIKNSDSLEQSSSSSSSSVVDKKDVKMKVVSGALAQVLEEESNSSTSSASSVNADCFKKVVSSERKLKTTENHDSDDENIVFSQNERVIEIEINSDNEDYYNNTLSFSSDFPEEEPRTKDKPYEEEDDDEEEIKVIEPEKREIEVINIDNSDLEQEQRGLFDKVTKSLRIKIEKIQDGESNGNGHSEVEMNDNDENPTDKTHPESKRTDPPKTLCLIDPLPQPHRKAFLRGISVNTLEDTLSRSFLKSTKSSLYKSNSNLKKLRSLKLKQLAEKEKKSKNESSFKKPTSAVKVFTSSSKIEKNIAKNGLKETEVFNFGSKLIEKGFMKRPCNSEDEEPNNRKKLKIGCENKKEKEIAEEERTDKPEQTSTVRIFAAGVVDNTGHKRLSKLSFQNALNNVFSQDLTNVPFPNSKVLSYSGIEPDQETKSSKKKREKKSVNWKEPLTDVRYIEVIGKGKKVCGNKDSLLSNCSEEETSELPPMTLDDVISHILTWNTAWLEEQITIKDVPDVHLKKYALTHVPPVFANFEDYCNVFFPLMFHELWQNTFEDFVRRRNHRIHQAAKILDVKVDRDCYRLRLRSLLTANDKRDEHFVRSGTLVRLHLHFKYPDGRKSIKPNFGFVSQNKILRRTENDENDFELVAVSPQRVAASKLIYVNEYTLKMKRRSPDDSELKYLYGLPTVEYISYIKPAIRLFSAVMNVSKSPLYNCLIKPLSLCNNSTLKGSELAGENLNLKSLNSIQSKIVIDVAHTCLAIPSEAPYVTLIQGPPGTGKSTVIASLIFQILLKAHSLNKPVPKILLTAPSNAAVDELVLKFKRLSKTIQTNLTFSLVRVGLTNSIHPEVMESELKSMADTKLEEMKARAGNLKSIQLEIQHRQSHVNQLGMDIADEEGKMDFNPSKLALLRRNLRLEHEKLLRAKNSAKRGPWSPQFCERKRSELMDEILYSADIVATTLSSSQNGVMTNSFLNNNRRQRLQRPFSICIMDEASQCVEPESLVPLGLGFTKLIMVGDTEQLSATVSSSKAKSLSYEQSLFNRLFRQSVADSSFRNKNNVFQLKMQYRMHHEIVRWPNHFFYGGELQNGVSSARCSQMYPLRLFDVRWTQEDTDGKSLFNTKEAQFVAKVVSELRRGLAGKDMTVGVITFYSRQRNHISLELQNLNIETTDSKRNGEGTQQNAVSIRTVDGFQGSECDVIVISCVRSNSNNPKPSIGFVAESERLNVALTRAKFALFVVGNFKVLSRNKMWTDFIKDAKKRNCVVNMEENMQDLHSQIFNK